MKTNDNGSQPDNTEGAAPHDTGAHTSARPQLSVVVPTKNEADNIDELLARIARATAGTPAEVIIVDDGDDHAPEVISKSRRDLPLSISFIRRPPERRGDGLGGAVAEGIRAATGEWVCVMDADLQHPPEAIPQLVNSARRTGAEICVASRFMESGGAGGLGLARLVASKLCTLAAKLFFPRRLWRVSDPLSGFFLLRREAVDPDRLRPRGFKILLEILIRFPHLAVSEVPFRFQSRRAGESKAALREGIRYLMLLLRLRRQGAPKRFIHFGLVGASGLAINQLTLGTLTDVVGVHYLASAALATGASSLWNFSLIEAWVYRDRGRQEGRLHRLVQFFLMNTGGLLLRGPFLVILTSGFGIHYLISNLITLLTLAWGRYFLADAKIWSPRREKAATPAVGHRSALVGASVWGELATNGHENAFFYDIHGVARIISEVRLVELDFFRTPHVIERPDIRIQIGRPRVRPEQLKATISRNGDVFRYREIPGLFGFWVDITRGECVEVVAGRLLGWSPHVLYTNVVEPILRWMLVRKGYALVHSACIVSKRGAVLITARTDTGKTTTVLRTLSQDGHGCEFLSDDMAIVGRDGLILNYPKPLTISRHTLEAVSGSPLNFRQRLALQIQSRVHSRSGRQAALGLARTRLPMATVNAIAQIIVPPPKYPIGSLIPGVTIASSASPSWLVIIERGADETETPLNHQEAMEVLFRNSEDAYGFPPYPKLAAYLQQWDGVDLRAVEREIVTEALSDCPATLMRSQQLNWWQRLPAFLNVSGPDALGNTRAGPAPLEV
jgi:glycosyltransferase involved in cell wall biosynthesis